MDSVTPDGPRRAPIRWHVATVRDACAGSPTARTLLLEVPGWPGHVAGQHVDVRLPAEDGYQYLHEAVRMPRREGPNYLWRHLAASAGSRPVAWCETGLDGMT